ncbi:MAG: isocitrate lyase/phosphoenolpyruvate mutase family protein [Citrobacter freundii]|nr:MAG: isocitrate lyase/phosphoenolpyruvate mutase family protein [Citrobacter freundii]
MSNKISLFRQLHQQAEPLLIGNVWNAQSAKVFEKAGSKAIATSSAAVAETLGYTDGENMRFEEYLFIIERIIKATSLPLSVDLETGYGDTPAAIAENIKHLSELGVVGVNIEDSVITNGNRRIVDLASFAAKISEVVQLVKTSGIDIFINLRSDVFLLGLPSAKEAAIDRTKLYNNTGVDGLFFPCITDIDDIRTITGISKLPVNVMCMPNLPNFEELKNAGVKRISMGNFVNGTLYRKLEELIRGIEGEQSFAGVV